MKFDWRHILAIAIGLTLLIGLILISLVLVWVFLILLAVSIVLGGLFYIYEKIRRWRADQGGFQEQLDEGAPHIHPELILALAGNMSEDSEDGVPVKPEPLVIGQITLGQDGLMAADPSFALCEMRRGQPVELFAFEESFPHGRFDLVMLRVTEPDQRVAALQLVFVEDEPAYLEPAWTPGERARARQMREMPALGVDSGTMAIGTPLAWQALAQMTHGGGLAPGPADPEANPFLSQTPEDLWRCVETPAGPVFVVYSGLGDGSYPVWIARAEDGTALSLIIDFRLLGPQARPIHRPKGDDDDTMVSLT